MSFITPTTSFHADHNAPHTAPAGLIRVMIECHGGDCAAGNMSVRVEEDVNPPVLISRGSVQCTGGPHTHDLQMLVNRPLQALRARLIFECGTQEREARRGMIWVRRP